MNLLVIPCFNEAKRLHVADFAKMTANIEFLFVDDGSSDGTSEFIRTQIAGRSGMKVLTLPQNVGKAEAIRQGMLSILAAGKFQAYEWIGFWDADLATPLFEVDRFIRYSQLEDTPPVAIWGSRIYRYGSHIVRSSLRHYFGRVFATVIDHLLGIDSYDSQCGAKLFRPQVLAAAFNEPFLSRWIFDVEIALRLKQKGILEAPVREWQDVPGSKVKVFREMGRVFTDILRIRKHYGITGRGRGQ